MRLCSYVLFMFVAVSTSTAIAVDVVDAIPESASFVIRLKNPEQLGKKIENYLNSFKAVGVPDLSDLTSDAPEFVDWQQGIWIIGFAVTRSLPPCVMIGVVKDVEKANEKNDGKPGPDGHVNKVIGNFFVGSDDDESLKIIEKCLANEVPRLWPRVDDAARQLFDASDISVFVNVPKAAEIFAEDLAQLQLKLDVWIENFCDDMVDETRAVADVFFGPVRQTMKLALKFIRDTTALTAGITITADTLRYEDRWQFKEGSPTSTALAGAGPRDLALMTRFPEKQLAYFDARIDFRPLVNWWLNLAEAGVLRKGSDEQCNER